MRQNICKDIEELNNIINKNNVIDVYTENFPLNSSRKHILFKYPWNFQQDGSYLGDKPQQH